MLIFEVVGAFTPIFERTESKFNSLGADCKLMREVGALAVFFLYIVADNLNNPRQIMFSLVVNLDIL